MRCAIRDRPSCAFNQWQDNGAFESFGHEGEAGQWNPTLWALVVGIWGLTVGIMALRVRFAEPPGRIGRLKFHVAAWVLGMLVLTPLWALIEWQDNGDFERFSNNSQPGNWEPWILYIGGIWAAVIAVFAVHAYIMRRTAASGDVVFEEQAAAEADVGRDAAPPSGRTASPKRRNGST